MMIPLFHLVGVVLLSSPGLPQIATPDPISVIREDLPGRDYFRQTGLLVIAGNLDGKPILALVDTGTDATIIDTSSIAIGSGPREFPVLREAVMALSTGTTKVPIVLAPCRFGNGDIRQLQAAVLDLKSLNSAVGISLNAVVGTDYLMNSPVSINGGTGELNFLATNDPLPSSAPDRLRFRRGKPTLNGSLPILGRRELMIDTGM